eukprot:CAMPEP_0172615438 /NCGR_PEP_ID=MMETSP1068-20121228/59236_1 /TAXON_ID=35684 /ORGANISM="Pseudopedinella elastica, Strain CCMP716" /LENGTH=353 /DNA_ID=CAMNT_0013420581 /DNA_START=52 /DNA_END=1113 /DNA_ORIENTATION=+
MPFIPRLASLLGLLSIIGSAGAFLPRPPVALLHGPSTRTSLKSSQGDTVTGTKFEETDEKKNPEKRPGHQVQGMPEVDPETAAKQERLREHQASCARLSWPEEIRGIMAQAGGFATLSTLHSKEGLEGYPLGSIVGFAVDDEGYPIFSFSGMSAHTKNVLVNPRASLCVTEPEFLGAADARTTVVGTMRILKGEERERAEEAYLKSHPNAYWVKFGDFTMFRMEELKEISFVGGFARAGSITPEEYSAASVDPCLGFAKPVMAHMNDDHGDSLKEYIRWIVGVDAELESVEMKRLDRFGFDCRVTQKGGSTGVLRVPFQGGEPVTERKDIKSAIVDLSKACAQRKAEAEAGAK